jgi:hypothetical protein
MVNLWKSGRLAGVLLAAGLVASAQQPQNRVARPGTINYVEGQVALDGQTLNRDSMGSAEAAAGQVLETQNGNAEMLLTPGVFVRLGNNSAVRMVSPTLANTQVQVVKGQAMVEADYVTKANYIAVLDNGYTTAIEKNGVYSFDANQPMVSVYDGEARVTGGNDKSVNVKKGKEVALVASNGQLKEQHFDTGAPSSLYAWSRLRSGYMAQANQALVQNIYVGGYPGWWGGGYGWAWNPYFDTFAFMPGYGYYASPFGFGFYSPAYFGAYGFRPGFVGRSGFYRAPATVNRGAVVGGGGFRGNGGFHGNATFGGNGGFSGARGMARGGGFHGGRR